LISKEYKGISELNLVKSSNDQSRVCSDYGIHEDGEPSSPHKPKKTLRQIIKEKKKLDQLKNEAHFKGIDDFIQNGVRVNQDLEAYTRAVFDEREREKEKALKSKLENMTLKTKLLYLQKQNLDPNHYLSHLEKEVCNINGKLQIGIGMGT